MRSLTHCVVRLRPKNDEREERKDENENKRIEPSSYWASCVCFVNVNKSSEFWFMTYYDFYKDVPSLHIDSPVTTIVAGKCHSTTHILVTHWNVENVWSFTMWIQLSSRRRSLIHLCPAENSSFSILIAPNKWIFRFSIVSTKKILINFHWNKIPEKKLNFLLSGSSMWSRSKNKQRNSLGSNDDCITTAVHVVGVFFSFFLLLVLLRFA